MKYKVGDNVRVISDDELSKIEDDEKSRFIVRNGYMLSLGKESKIKRVLSEHGYILDDYAVVFYDWMISGLSHIQKHSIQRRKFSKIGNAIY